MGISKRKSILRNERIALSKGALAVFELSLAPGTLSLPVSRGQFSDFEFLEFRFESVVGYEL